MRWLQSRNVRKFLRSRLAVAALIVVLLYAAVAAVIGICDLTADEDVQPGHRWGDLLTLESTLIRVGPANLPGFFLEQTPEKRLEDAEFFLETVERELRRRNSDDDPWNLNLGNLEVADLTRDELKTLIEQANDIATKLAESENLDNDPSLAPQLDELESIVEKILPHPPGTAGEIRNVQLALGTDRQGRSILIRAIYSIKVAIQIGVVTALISVIFGSLLGCAAGYFGSWVDHVVIWLYTTLSSIPSLVLLVVLAYMFSELDVAPFTKWLYEASGETIDWTGWQLNQSLIPVYIAFCMTFWIGPCRVMRGETMKLKELEYVQAADAAGFGRLYIMLRHILPNASHLMLINFSLLFIGAIKSEVILSFLGLGVKEGPSWGIMISQSGPEVVNNFFWQIGTATAFMFGLVLAFNVLSDALQDVFDPKHL